MSLLQRDNDSNDVLQLDDLRKEEKQLFDELDKKEKKKEGKGGKGGKEGK